MPRDIFVSKPLPFRSTYLNIIPIKDREKLTSVIRNQPEQVFVASREDFPFVRRILPRADIILLQPDVVVIGQKVDESLLSWLRRLGHRYVQVLTGERWKKFLDLIDRLSGENLTLFTLPSYEKEISILLPHRKTVLIPEQYRK